MPVTTITSFDEFQTIIKSGKIVIIDFWAEWCGPCRIISPVFEELSESARVEGVDIQFCKVNVDEQESIASELGIRAMPTFMVFHDGNKLDESVGANRKKLEELITKAANALQ